MKLQNLQEKEYWDEIIATYELFKTQKAWYGKTIEGLVYSDFDNIQAIMRTEQFIIPEVQKIQRTLQMLDPKSSFNKEELLNYFTGFKRAYPKYEKQIIEIEKGLIHEETVTMATLKKLLNTKSDKGKFFNIYLMKKCNKLLYAPIRGEELKEEYSVTDFKGIHYYENQDNGTITYYVGSNQALNQTIARGVVIREISSLIDIVDCKEILKLTSVEFVRSGQFTVLPFLYKYLRELPTDYKSS